MHTIVSVTMKNYTITGILAMVLVSGCGSSGTNDNDYLAGDTVVKGGTDDSQSSVDDDKATGDGSAVGDDKNRGDNDGTDNHGRDGGGGSSGSPGNGGAGSSQGDGSSVSTGGNGGSSVDGGTGGTPGGGGVAGSAGNGGSSGIGGHGSADGDHGTAGSAGSGGSSGCGGTGSSVGNGGTAGSDGSANAGGATDGAGSDGSSGSQASGGNDGATDTDNDYRPVCNEDGFCIDQRRISAGVEHTCAITSLGRAMCWGSNRYGMLGDKTVTDRLVPTPVVGLDSRVVEISAGTYHTCAVTSAGAVKCWGSNPDGRLGDGTTITRNVPTQVSGLTSGVIAVSAGHEHTCALTEEGSVLCWGYNGYGRLGDGTFATRLVPTQVVGLSSEIVAISSGGYHTCAVAADGGVWCWGYNGHGTLGDGTTVASYVPIQVSGLSASAISISAGYEHTCALTAEGAVECWGLNSYGCLGDGTVVERHVPTQVLGLTGGVVGVSTGNFHTCAVTDDGIGKCWGFNHNGRLGDGTTSEMHVPTDVSWYTNDITSISAGYDHTCAIASDMGFLCWGYNGNGRLGNNTTSDSFVPTRIAQRPLAKASQQ